MSLGERRPGSDPGGHGRPGPLGRPQRWRLRHWIGLVLAVTGLVGITPLWGFLHPGTPTPMLHFVGATLMTLAGVVVFTFERLPQRPPTE